MNKMNKKGFTLIEMLVVIAIIAVLVAIIIPTVSSATTKAKAAADAANLRSLVAEATTDLLAGGKDEKGLVKYTPNGSNKPAASDFDVTGAPACKTDSTWKAKIIVNADGTLDAAYNETNIAGFAAIADGSAKSN